MIRTMKPADFDWVLRLNQAHESATSVLDMTGLVELVGRSSACLVTDDEMGFLIAQDQACPAESVNFHWFKQRYERFCYVDRIVVAEHAAGRGLGRMLYQAVFELAGDDPIVCEVNFDPPNPGSDAFHQKLGFGEVGRASLTNGKTVRYLIRTVTGLA
jgi:uncharacterized protein